MEYANWQEGERHWRWTRAQNPGWDATAHGLTFLRGALSPGELADTFGSAALRDDDYRRDGYYFPEHSTQAPLNTARPQWTIGIGLTFGQLIKARGFFGLTTPMVDTSFCHPRLPYEVALHSIREAWLAARPLIHQQTREL